MKRILIFSGTTEGRQLADILDASGICADVCVATEYGHEVMTEGQYRNIYTGRLTEEEMKEFMQKGDYAAIVDATHPYAVVVSSNIRQASAQAGLPYYRLRRTLQSAGDDSDVIYVKSQQECVRALEQTSGNILLTTGSKELHCYCENEALRERLFVRVLPGTESIEICHKNGILGRQIIAMQGPFSEKMNLALLHQYQIRYMVTKESGASGGFSEKISAAKKAGVSVFVIENPEAENGEQKENLEEIIQEIERLTGKHIRRKQMQVSLVGIGMGNTKLITEEAAERIKGADLLFGAKRLLDAVPAQWNVAAERLPYYLAKDILPCLDDAGEKSGKAIFHAVILFSGDTGFYSGAEKMVQALQGRENTEMSVCPGISSVSYLAARSGNSWQDAKIVSLHGTDQMERLIKTAGMREKVFVITSGVSDVREIGKRLIECGLKETTVTVGYALSYPAEQIKTLSPEECMQLTDEGLYTCLIQNQGISGEKKNSDPKAIKDITCKKWIDVRTFGQVFPFKGLGSVSTGIRGCMSLSPAISLNIPDVKEYQIIKSTNLDETSDGRKDNATLFYQHRIVESAYVTYGSIHCQLAETNGFTEEDAEKIHHALITLFDNDVSSTRPAGSMNVQRVYWWKHNCKFGQYAPIKVFKTLDIKSEKEYPFFSVTENPLPNLIPDIYIL